MKTFDEALEFVVKWEEKKKTDEPIKMGISQRVFDTYRLSNGLPLGEIRKMARKEAKSIYYSKYWDTIHADAFPDKIGILLFDTVVDMGLNRAVEILREVLDSQKSSKWRPDIIKRIHEKPEKEVLKTIFDIRERYYKLFAKRGTEIDLDLALGRIRELKKLLNLDATE